MSSPISLFLKASLIWFLMMACETVHGIVRVLFLQPRVGDRLSRQLGMLTGSAIIFGVAYLFIGWLRPETPRRMVAVGFLWAALTFGFEILMGLAQGFSWNRILAEYDPSRGGLMAFGLAFMIAVPALAVGRWEKKRGKLSR